MNTSLFPISPPDSWTALNDLKAAIERDHIAEFLSQDITTADITGAPDLDHIRIVSITRIRFRRRGDLQKALEAFYRILHKSLTSFIYILSVEDDQTELCVGFYVNDEADSQYLIHVFNSLQATIRGIFPGCSFEPLRGDKIPLIKRIMELPERQVITGVPSIPQDKESRDSGLTESSIAGVERLIDAMVGQEFTLVVVATPLPDDELAEFQGRIAQLHDQVQLLRKASLQQSNSHQTSFSGSYTKSEGTQESTTTGNQISYTKSRQEGHFIHRFGKNVKAGMFGGVKAQTQESIGSSEQQQRGTSYQKTEGSTYSEATTTGGAVTIERTSKTADYIGRLLDEMYQRVQNARGVGMWRVGTTFLARDPITCEKAANIYAGMIAGEKSHIDPVRAHRVHNTVNAFSVAHDFYGEGHPLGASYAGLYTYLTSQELSVSSGFPFQEVAALPVEEITEYGRSLERPKINDTCRKIELGKLVDRSEETAIPVTVSTRQLNRHCFVTGATGSGKSNTMRQLLVQIWKDLHIPFLVIEPVKSEYRQLHNQIPDLQVFTLGHNTGSTFALNPFDFEQEVGLVSHIDHLKAAFNASLGMYSSMPFILEDIIYRVYESFGWDLGTGKNGLLEQSARRLSVPVDGPIRDLLLPSLSDLLPLVQKAIEGFFPSMTDYGGSLLGALRARLTSLTKGTKGRLLDARRSVSFKWLLERPCVLEIWPFADNEEKSFVMALILVKLYEYRECQHLMGHRPTELEHLLVVEEAHRLLAKPQGNTELSGNSRAKGVEVFADILAEIRSYGQGIVIIDQIPSKLIPDVLKNTDLKIAHRLLAKDDRELVGSTMTLEEAHIRDLARHEPGFATVYFEGLHAPVKVKIVECEPGKAATSPKAVDLQMVRSLECFGYSLADTMAFFPDSAQQIQSYQLVHGVLTTALSIGKDGAQRMRDNLKQQLSFDPVGSEWAFMVGGLHTLHGALLKYERDPGERLLSPANAGYLVSLAASFLRNWLTNDDFTESLAILRAESIGVGLLSSVSFRGMPNDLLCILAGLYVQGTAGNFHRAVTGAIKSDACASEIDWSNLQDELNKHCHAMVLSSKFDKDVFCELASRLLIHFQTKDPELASMTGLALGTLLKATAGLDQRILNG